MSETKEGDGNLLDNTMLLAGAAFGDPNIHDPSKLAILVGGGLAKRGENVVVQQGTTRSDLLLAIVNKFGIEQTAIGDSTRALTEVIA
jgi:hypothetical protein